MGSETNAAIEDLVQAMFANDAPAREMHVFRESLRALVRLAKAEHTTHARSSLKKLLAAPMPAPYQAPNQAQYPVQIMRPQLAGGIRPTHPPYSQDQENK